MPKIVDRDQYRKELLGKCFELFAEKGYASVTMREIARGIGVSTGTLYHYFPSKEVLFEQLIDQLIQQDVRSAAAELENAKTLAERIEAAFDFFARNEDYFIKQTAIWVDFFQHRGRDTAERNDVFKRVEEQGERAVAELLGIQEPALAKFLMCFLDGLILHRMFEGEGISFSEQAKLLTRMLMAYLERGVDTSKESMEKL
jgi:AcrR family transcriptional regulator